MTKMDVYFDLASNRFTAISIKKKAIVIINGQVRNQII